MYFSPHESGSDLASVVDVGLCWTPWKKLEDWDPFTVLHAKFWGKSMAIEEQEWHKEQSLGSGYDGDDPMEKDVVESLDEGLETDDDDDDDDDIIPGCYLLDIGCDFSPVWIRADYIRIYDALEAYYKETPLRSFTAPAAVITGQPGIGKSMWIYYALRRRLAEKKPVIWYRDQTCYLFVDEGVYMEPVDFQSRHFKTYVWTLVDSDESRDGVPLRLVLPGTHHYVIYITFPCEKRWSRLHKTTHEIIVFMNPWTRNEIFRAASLLLPESPEFARISWIYDHLGPTPRLCLGLLLNSRKLKVYEDEVEKTVSNITSGQLEKLITETACLTMDAVSHEICLLTREKRDDMHSEASVVPITPFIRSRLVDRFRNLEQAENIRMYKRLEKFPGCRVMAGIFFEAAAQRHLPGRDRPRLLTMVQLTECLAMQKRES